MSPQVNVAVYISGQETLVPAEAELYSSKERLKKAAQALGICWAVALLSVPVPVLHFVIVPTALLMGPIAGFFVYLKVKNLPKSVKGSVPCLNCHATTQFSFVDQKPPLFDACSHCRTGYEVLWPPRS